MTWATQAKAALQALGATPTPEQARAVTDRFEDTDVEAALVSMLGDAGGGGGGEQPVLSATTVVDSAAILAAFTSPPVVLAGVTDKVILPLWCVAVSSSGTPYAGVAQAYVFGAPALGRLGDPLFTDVLTVAGQCVVARLAADAADDAFAAMAGIELTLVVDAPPTDGDMAITFTTTYLLIDAPA